MGRFGVRYGNRVKKINLPIEKIQNKKQECPFCERLALKRIASGIWFCRKCRAKFAGGAYFPKTQIAEINLNAKQENKNVNTY